MNFFDPLQMLTTVHAPHCGSARPGNHIRLSVTCEKYLKGV